MTTPSDKITVYDAANSDRISIRAWRVMFQELWEYRELIHRLVLRNLAGQFRQSFLGYLWIALPPIATTIVFTLLRQAKVMNVPMPAGSMPYALFALVGTTLWQYFSQVTLMATTSVSGGGNLVSKIYFPREVLALSAVGSAVMNLFIRLLVVVISFMCFMYSPHWQIVYVPLILIPLTFFGLGLGLLFAPINTVMHDMGRLLEFAFQFGMFLAPTIYPTPDLATATSGWQKGLYWLHTINPVSHYINAIDSLIENGTFVWDAGFSMAMIVSFLTFAIGWRFFHIGEPLIAERM